MQDYAFILKVLKKYKIGVLPKVLVKARVLETSMTYSISTKQILKEKLELLNYNSRNSVRIYQLNFLSH